VRAAGSEVFASLVRLLPLDGCVPDPPDMPEHLCQQRLHHREFLKQLMDGKRAHHYPLPVLVSYELRQYQQVSTSILTRFKLAYCCEDKALHVCYVVHIP
jgi:TATA-binding protein-associated factor